MTTTIKTTSNSYEITFQQQDNLLNIYFDIYKYKHIKYITNKIPLTFNNYTLLRENKISILDLKDLTAFIIQDLQYHESKNGCVKVNFQSEFKPAWF